MVNINDVDSTELTTIEEIIKGLLVIRESQPTAYFAAEHDEIWCGEVEDTPEEDKEALKAYNWNESGGNWHKYV